MVLSILTLATSHHVRFAVYMYVVDFDEVLDISPQVDECAYSTVLVGKLCDARIPKRLSRFKPPRLQMEIF